MDKTYTYSELLTQSYEVEPLYLGFQDAIALMDFAEASHIYHQLEELHSIQVSYVGTLDYAEGDYSFGGLLDFIKKAASAADEGMLNHAIATTNLKSKASDFLENLTNNISANLSQKQYENLTSGRKDYREFGKYANLAKLQKAIGEGWDRHNAVASKSGGILPERSQAAKQEDDEYLQALRDKAARDRGERQNATADPFVDRDPPVAPPTPAPAPAPADPWDGEADQEEKNFNQQLDQSSQALLAPGKDDEDEPLEPLNTTKKSSKGKKWGIPGEKKSKPSVYGGFGKNRKLMQSAKDAVANGTSYADYHQAFLDKADQESDPQKAESYRNQAQSYLSKNNNKSMGASNKYEKQYKVFADRARSAKSPEDRQRFALMAKEYKAKMAYSEAIAAGNLEFAEEFLNAAANVVTKREGLNFAENLPTAGEILTKACYYSFCEGDCAEYGEDKEPEREYPNDTPQAQAIRDRIRRMKESGVSESSGSYGEDTPEAQQIRARSAAMKQQMSDDLPRTEASPAYENDTPQAQAIRARIQAMKKSGVSESNGSYGEDEDQQAPEPQDMMQMLEALSPEEKAQLIEMLESSMGEAKTEKPSAAKKEDAGDKDDKDDKEEKKEPKKDEDEDEDFGEQPMAYSENLAREDQVKDEFISTCRNAFSDFQYVNQHYNVPLQFAESGMYDFSEWVDSFRKANSAAFNLYGNECGFNGKLPRNFVVVPAEENTDAAWSVYDRSGKFITLSGIEEFKPLAFSENFKTSYCKASQGSTVKSDRIARAVYCSK